MNLAPKNIVAYGLLLAPVVCRVIKYKCLLKKLPFKTVADGIEKRYAAVLQKRNSGGGGYRRLQRIWGISTCILVKLLRDRKPCLVRALIVYEACRTAGLAATLVVGTKKENGGLVGHSWIEIDRKPYRENQLFLRDYEVMLRYPVHTMNVGGNT